MTSTPVLQPSLKIREEFRVRGGGFVSRCYQCGACTAACNLSTRDYAFPRRQMSLAQWGLAERLVSDPAVWLCHRCNDCATICPRNVRPGDVMQVARAVAIEKLAFPRCMGKMTARVQVSWPLLLGLPVLFWLAYVAAVTGLAAPIPSFEHGMFAYERFVPHWMIYSVFFPVSALVAMVLFIQGRRFWNQTDGAQQRRGPILAHVARTGMEIVAHRRFGLCGIGGSRRWSHLTLLGGFAGAALTSGLLIIAIYFMDEAMPLSLWHPFKILGNVSAVLLVVGGGMLVRNRICKPRDVGATTAVDAFFIGVVCLVIASGILTELARICGVPYLGCWLYVTHLGAVLCLFLVAPYSMFAHVLYRFLAMLHEYMTRSVPEPRLP